ncbi:MAG TPA: tetratricopeptide repeat protein [Spongiibacteraceae bacterium]|nr:tetratricopeptide repeat protein [Spongiibacteraceae bacterium]
MEVYQSEDEQVEALKKWFRENGRAVLTGLALVGLLVFGGYSWQQRQHRQQELASVDYQNLIQAIQQLETKATPEALATARHLADTLKTDFSSTTYAQFAALFKAKMAVQSNSLDDAEAELRWALAHKPAAEIKLLTQLRLARVLHAKGDNAGALALLDETTAGGYASAFLQMKGDIANASGDFVAARGAYEKAQELERKQTNPVNDPLLDMKLRDLAAGDNNGGDKAAIEKALLDKAATTNAATNDAAANNSVTNNADKP